MVLTGGGHSFRPRVRNSSPSGAAAPGPSPSTTAAPASYPSASAALAPSSSIVPAATAVPLPATTESGLVAPAAPATTATPPSASPTASAPTAGLTTTILGPAGVAADPPPSHKCYTIVGPTPSSPSHPRPARKAQPSKRARLSGLGESSGSLPQQSHSPPFQGPTREPPLPPTSIIQRPLFHCGPILRNLDCSSKEVHSKVCYDFPTFSADPKLIDSMRLVQ